jgi:hypothetical protein
MHYWKGPRQTLKEAPMRYSMDDDSNLFLKPGPGRKLKLELELLLVMMRLRLGLLVHHLAWSDNVCGDCCVFTSLFVNKSVGREHRNVRSPSSK